MNSIAENIQSVRREIGDHVKLVAVSKNHPAEAILEAYRAGQRIFGENRVQEILAKRPLVPADVEWHMIGHLQSNKVKQIAPFIAMIQSVDTLKLLSTISEEALKHNRVIDCLLQVHIASEETKFGFDETELRALWAEIRQSPLKGVQIRGLMGMATFTDDTDQVRMEFRGLKTLFDSIKAEIFPDRPGFDELSFGMSGDYLLAIGEGSTLVRIGTKIFGSR